ncbi:hypothetical protein RDWZM_003598 [Blomia tropicalis]|uniref:Uncharacterized protein n=1 Tax=Blomia tropicalis TaxID=40697 RepID=A0A9Q0RR12_BLOTA|nr:hypothetical protein RDWZM_003598 [Blomia tropicalis]
MADQPQSSTSSVMSTQNDPINLPKSPLISSMGINCLTNNNNNSSVDDDLILPKGFFIGDFPTGTPTDSGFLSSSSSEGESSCSDSPSTMPSEQLNSFLSCIKTVNFDYLLRIERIRLSWKETDWHKLDKYQLRIYLLLDDEIKEHDDDDSSSDSDEATITAESSKNRRRGRKLDQKVLTAQPIVATRTLSLSNNVGFSEICFDDAELKFRTKVPIVQRSKRHGSGYVFRSRVVRVKLERIKHSKVSGGDHRVTIGFVDIDLAHYRHQHRQEPDQRQDGFVNLPMVLFADYNRHILHHQRSCDLFCFDIRLKLESSPIPEKDSSSDQSIWASVGSLSSYYNDEPDNTTLTSSATCPSLHMHLSQMLLRRDSLPNLSQDKELKYHDSPPTSRTKHILNLLGFLPAGKLFRVSIHFGQIEHLNHHLLEAGETESNSSNNVNKNITGSICACFEVKHHQHQPTIFHPHHQRHSICCRTKQLSAETKTDHFDQHFTFFERFYYQDSPITCLSVMNGFGKKLYKFKSHLADYIHCRSVNQYFALQNKKTGQYCRLQFSIVVKPIFSSTADTY